MLFALVALAACVALAQAPPVVQTAFGPVSGTMDQGVYAFRGLRFASPPVRFADPVDPVPWTAVYNGSTFGPGCIAECPTYAFPKPAIMCTPTVSEDCLFANVYTPTLNANANLPVIVFFHGGNYIGGSGGVPLYDGGRLASTQNVVVVTTNYRLGVLGGLFTGTVRGNFQTKDQRQSLKWIQRTIASFGGNPNLVTITGQSAGAFSVATHLTSPKSWPYFQRAIIVSNPFGLPAATPAGAMDLGQQILDKVGCPSGGDDELNCLRALSPWTIMAAQNSTDYIPWPGKFFKLAMQWVPVVDGPELPYQPSEAIRKGQFNPVPVMLGTVANESVQFVYDIVGTPVPTWEYYGLLDFAFGDLATNVTQQYGPLPPQFASDARPFVSVIVTDVLFYCDARNIGTALAKVVPTYEYFFDLIASYQQWVFGAVMPWCVNVVCHADDLPFIFNPFNAPMNVSHPQFTPAEAQLSTYIQTVWANFARTGNPSSSPLPLPVNPPLFVAARDALVNYSLPVSLLTRYRSTQCDFWDSIWYTNHV